MITWSTMNYQANRAFALAELLEVSYDQAFQAVNDGTDDPESVLQRLANLLHSAHECANSLAMDISNLMGNMHSAKARQARAPISKPGHKAALAWYADLDSRITVIEEAKRLKGYCVESKLREAFELTAPDQQGAFLDAVGAYLMTFKVIGEPSNTFLLDDERLRFYALTPEEQDAQADALEAKYE